MVATPAVRAPPFSVRAVLRYQVDAELVRSPEYVPLSSSSPVGPMVLSVGSGGDETPLLPDAARRLWLRPFLVRPGERVSLLAVACSCVSLS